jgi:enamine deaminase RidA (YjgF/YER057c/UK114 family)
MEFLQPPGWAPPRGYANGVAARGHVVFVAGQIGWNPATGQFESDDFAAQAEQALQNIATVLREAGAETHHVVRLTWFITDKRAYLAATQEIGAAYRRIFGRHFPAMSVVVIAGLLEDRAVVEIEATAVLPE